MLSVHFIAFKSPLTRPIDASTQYYCHDQYGTFASIIQHWGRAGHDWVTKGICLLLVPHWAFGPKVLLNPTLGCVRTRYICHKEWLSLWLMAYQSTTTIWYIFKYCKLFFYVLWTPVQSGLTLKWDHILKPANFSSWGDTTCPTNRRLKSYKYRKYNCMRLLRYISGIELVTIFKGITQFLVS